MNNAEAEFYLQQATQDMDDGTSRRIACFACGDRTMSVTRENGRTLYHCFRASCETNGVLTGDYAPPVDFLPRQTLKPCGIAMHGISNLDLDFFAAAFYLADTRFLRRHVRVTDADEYALEILKPQSEHRGWVIRQPWFFSGRFRLSNRPKALTYLDEAGPKLAWYLPPGWSPTLPLYVVEDQVSAMRLREAGVAAVALLGTDLTLEGVREIQHCGFSLVNLALDPDATNKAFGLANKWGHAFKRTYVKILDKDIKNMYPADLARLLAADGG